MSMLARRLRHCLFMLFAWCLLMAICFSLRVVGYRQTSRYLIWISPTPDSQEKFDSRAKVAAKLVGRVAHSPLSPKSRCLARSLLLWTMLRLLGIASTVKTGISKDKSGQLSGHAWVVHAGQVLNDRPNVALDYAPQWSDLDPEIFAKVKQP